VVRCHATKLHGALAREQGILMVCTYDNYIHSFFYECLSGLLVCSHSGRSGLVVTLKKRIHLNYFVQS